MKKLFLVLLLVLGLGVMSAGMVQADVINVGDPLPALPTTWYAFFAGEAGTGNSFGVGTNVANNITPGAAPWTYNAATATAVKITDTATVGDIYRLYDFGAVVGDTSTVPTTWASVLLTPTRTRIMLTLYLVMVFSSYRLGTIRSPLKSSKMFQPLPRPSATSGSILLRFPCRPAPCCWAPACWGWWDGGDSGRLNRPLVLATNRCRVSHGPAFFVVYEAVFIAIAKSFFRYGKAYNPPCPPLKKGGNYKELLLKSPFSEKGGFRGNTVHLSGSKELVAVPTPAF